MSSAVTTLDLLDYKDKRVILTVIDAENNEALEVEATVVSPTPEAILVKPKGSAQLKIYNVGEIERIELAPDSSKKIRAKKIKPITLGKARSHLLERHGVTLAWANGVSEEDAFRFHSEIDHVEEDLGHVHVDKSTQDSSDSADEPDEDDTDED